MDPEYTKMASQISISDGDSIGGTGSAYAAGEEDRTKERGCPNGQHPDTGQRLAQILAQIEGVGKVNVMLTVAESEKTLYQSDEDVTTGDNSSSVRQETILINDSDRNQQALITQVISPKYQGAVIVCQGADIPIVKWAVVEAVSKATGLGADQISVLKMK